MEALSFTETPGLLCPGRSTRQLLGDTSMAYRLATPLLYGLCHPVLLLSSVLPEGVSSNWESGLEIGLEHELCPANPGAPAPAPTPSPGPRLRPGPRPPAPSPARIRTETRGSLYFPQQRFDFFSASLFPSSAPFWSVIPWVTTTSAVAVGSFSIQPQPNADSSLPPTAPDSLFF